MAVEIKKDAVVLVTNAVIAVALLALVWQRVITWPQALGALGLLLAPSIAKRARSGEERTRKDDDDQDPPLTGGTIPLVNTPIMLLALAFAFHSQGCASATPQEKAAAAEATFTSDMVSCVDKSATIQESRACRAKVRERWHVDAGAGR